MKPKRFNFRTTSIFGNPLKYGAPLFIGFTVLISGLDAHGGDILRGGSSASNKPASATAGAPTPAATDVARANAKDTLARTTRSLDAARAMQNAARNAAIKNGANHLGKNPNNLTVTLPKVPNGLVTGGLKVAPTVPSDPTKWIGAKLPTQTVKNAKTKVTIKQTEQQALLNWETFNVGKNTAVTFDQTKGGADVGKWIAFNKITDPSGNPTQILGNIKAGGQVYLINTNGIIFGGTSQVNARGLTVSSLPINTNLIDQGLLNNRDAQFLFSGLSVPGGADGTPNFNPELPPAATGEFGDVTVQKGAILKSPADSGGSGGRIMLVGPNVTNNGTISTESGQTILAAGLQVGVAAHDGNDPSLRGLDVWVGDVGSYGGIAVNGGIIEAYTGSIWIAGKNVNQLGAIDSSTSVSLNGRIDLKASYGAVANPNFDSTSATGSGGPRFLNQFTGTVTLGEGSSARILPDYLSKKAVPGIALPERSQINIEGLAIHFDKDSSLFAPNAEVVVRAGSWPYKDADGDRTIFANGLVEAGLALNFSGSTQKFFYDKGQIYIDESATINVAGSVDVFVPLSQSILTIELRGNELADSPLQRDTDLRGVPLTVDIRNTGTYNGKYWIGTPLGDVTGLAGLIERNAAQLTAVGGNITLRAGESIVLRKSSSLDVSGGYFKHEAGPANTSFLIKGGRLVAIKDATPDQQYDGVFNGSSTFTSEKWGVSKTFDTPLFGGLSGESFVEGAAGGTLTLTAPSMALDGELRGATVSGPRQRSTPAAGGVIKISFEAEKSVGDPGSPPIGFVNYSPTPPDIRFGTSNWNGSTPEFTLVDGAPVALPAGRVDTVVLSSSLLGEKGFGSLEVFNPDGAITVPEDVTLAAAPKGSITLSGANITILGSVIAPGGKLVFTTYNISPSEAAEFEGSTGNGPFPIAAENRGMFVLGKGAALSATGLVADDREFSTSPVNEPIITGGGEISVRSFNADLRAKSVIDVSGGVFVSDKNAKTYGKGGRISIVTGSDAGFQGVIGGTLNLNSKLRGYSGTTGGSLNLQASLIQVGGAASAGVLNLSESFFRDGGFASYSLTGIGAKSDGLPPAGQFESYIPAISITAGARIRPLAESLIAEEDPANPGEIRLRRFVNEDGLRSPVSLGFTGLGSDDPFTIDSLEVRADIVMGKGASIRTEPGASVSFKAGTVTLLGEVIARDGKISVAGARSFPLTGTQRLQSEHALPTVHLGDSSRLSAAGNVQLTPDAFGRRTGRVLDGGTITVTGNIIAEKGSQLDVSGASGILDLGPAALSSAGELSTGGLTSTPNGIVSVPTRVDSDGGSISLTGSEMLASDATLLGAAGGSTALGGTLLISSGKFNFNNGPRTSADTNLIITQSGDVIRDSGSGAGVGIPLTDATGTPYGDLGLFSLEHFREGSFSSLGLNGNIEFQGPVNLVVPGSLRVAAGGVIHATDTVSICASYIAVGQDFRAPENPDDVFVPFSQQPTIPTPDYFFPPTFGSGILSLRANLIDLGTLSLQGIGKVDLTAKGGDIRGNGTLSVAGDVTLTAANIYPTSLASFDIFAYDHTSGTGSVTVKTSGKSDEIPISAGGNLGIYASTIRQDGILRAPLGTITLGWDGTDLDPSDADIDSPYNIIAGATISSPVTGKLTLGNASLTSVSAATEKGKPGWIAPFGINPDGQTWIDPRGVNVTLNGLPEKSVSIKGESVEMGSGAVIDIRGGGELFATRWLQGLGGSMDLLGSASSTWAAGTEYEAGDLVSFGGANWSARVRNTGQSPVVGPSWSKLPESYAIIPTSGISFAPINSYNTGSNASLLSADPGFVNSNLKVGATITLDGSEGLPAGTYTLLPARYALLNGAYLLTANAEGGTGTVTKADGASIVSGYIGNRFNETQAAPLQRLRFEIASAKVVATRVDYDTYTATEFLGKIAEEQGVSNPQQLPGDAGYAGFHGNSALRLAGSLLTQSPGIGARVDVSSFADIHLSDSASGSSVGGSVVLDTSVLTSWGAESLLIGGLRREGDGTTTLDVRTDSLTLDNATSGLTASDVVLASNGLLEVTAGSSITAAVDSKYSAAAMSVSGDGTLLRISADADALTSRTNFTGATTALMKIGESAEITGESVVLDSTYGSKLASNLKLAADILTLGSGQISLLLDDAPGTLAGSVVSPHLVLSGKTLADAFSSRELTLRSYRSIDIYGTGQIGNADLAKLTLAGSGVRGYGQAGGDVVIRASEVVFDNSISATSPGMPVDKSGSLTVDANRIGLGSNAISVNGYQNLALNASAGLTVQGVGTFSTTANLNVRSPLVSGEARTSYSILSSGAMVLDPGSGNATPGGALGAGITLQAASIKANTDILLPSGELTLRATAGPLEIGGNLSVAGSFREFGDLIRYSDAGTITLESVTGDVKVLSGADVTVSASDAGGNAGTLSVRAAQGVFANSGSLHGDPAVGALGSQAATSGRFLLDVGSLDATGTASLGRIGKSLDDGGFHAARNFRVHHGDITIDNLNRSHEFALTADRGSILVNGTINASGQTGGSISLAAHGDLTLASGSQLNAGAVHFNSAGKGGSILLEAGTQLEGVANTGALLDLKSGSQIYLGVSDDVAGDYKTPGSSAFEGKFTGTLHLRAPRTATNNDLRVGSIQSTILGESSVVVEGFKVYTPANGVLNIAQRNLINTDAVSFLGAAGVGNANEGAMRTKLLTGASAGLDSLLVLAPGVEIINRTGDLTLGLANNTSSGSTSAEALSTADWDLSEFRYGSKSAAGVLTLRAQGNLVFNNTLSDGFNPIAQGTAQVFADNGHSRMWLATLMKVSDKLPVNTQSWSYRLTAGADTNSGNSGSVLSTSELDLLQPGKGSVIVGEFYPAVPNNTTTGLGAGVGVNGQTADSIRISTTTVDRGNRFEVIRTGTGDIAINAGRDVQLRNQFSTIYTAGVALPDPTTIFSTGDFVSPILPTSLTRHPGQSVTGTLGAIQQLYPATWSMAGGNVSLSAGANIGRYTLVNGILTADSTRQMPTNWLYRRGYVDPATGLFASNGGFGETTTINNASNINDAATSTTWWIDYSNFFQGIGTLGGGNISLTAGNDIVNVDAVAPTNARMAGRTKNPDFGIVANAPEFLNLAPNADNLLEFGGGDVTVTAGRNIDGGVYYVEKGKGILNAGGEITTNRARALTPGILNNSSPRDSLTWLPTTLFVGKSSFDVTARGDILLGPVTNPFLLPQGINNKYWYKTYFNTFSENAGANILSLGGDVTHRTEVTPNGGSSADSILKLWFTNHNLYTGNPSAFNSSNFQPWLRLAELNLGTFDTVFKLFAPNLRSTALGGDVHLVGDITLAPSATGDLELAAAGGIIGLNPTGEGRVNGRQVQVWTSSNLNLSDAAPETIPGIANPLGYQLVAGRDQAAHFESGINILGEVSRALNESGSYAGEAGTQRTKTALHDGDILHASDRLPVTLYATTGDITGLTLFSPKKARILAGRDISDVSLYLQNLKKDDITLVSAGRDILAFNETSEVRSQADNLALGNAVGDSPKSTVTGGSSKATAGDIRISGPGVLQVVSGRYLDLGTGSNFIDGTGTGISSIGNLRNPFLPFGGAAVIALAGVTAADGDGPADGLADSSMDIAVFISKYLTGVKKSDSAYWKSIGGGDFEDLTDEQQAIVALGEFYQILRDAGRAAAETGSYKPGYKAVKALFGKGRVGDIFTRSREIRTTSGGGISVGVPDGGITMASEIVGNPLTPPGIVTEFGGSISTFTHRDVNLGQARIFTLRGGDIIMWSSKGNIAAGSSPRTVVTAPPTRVVFDISSASVQTDLGGLATGGGIGVLAAVEGVKPGKVGIYAPQGYVDAGDAGIRATGDIEIGAQVVLNAGNISSGGTTTGAVSASVSAPSVSAVTSASNASAAAGAASVAAENKPATPEVKPVEESLSLITVEVIGYGGGSSDEEKEEQTAE